MRSNAGFAWHSRQYTVFEQANLRGSIIEMANTKRQKDRQQAEIVSAGHLG
jgi:hypothetical protein